MKRTRQVLRSLILTTAIFAAIFYYYYKQEPTFPVPSPPVEPSPSFTSSGMSEINIPSRIMSKKKIVTHPVRPEGENVVEFQVVDGLAIAYGDLILGKLDEESSIKQGYYEAPPPQFWDKPEIPYSISPDLPNPERVEKAIEYFRKNTPVIFVPYQGQKDSLVFEPGNEHCFSALGKVGGAQPIRLSPGCQPPEIIHEIMHSIGFIHEQSRPDRDQYVTIQWENIEDKYKGQFAIVPNAFAEILRDSPFDFHSAMLYGSHDFAVKHEFFTMKSKGSEQIDPTQNGLSEIDLRRLNKLYHLTEY